MIPLQLPVLIVGTGPSGLLLANALKKASIPFQLFESDSALDVRGQGYRFKIKDVGIQALQNGLEPSHYEHLKRSCCTILDGFTDIDALTGAARPNEMFKKKKFSSEELCADRTLLRLVLARGLEDKINFNHRIKKYTLSDDGTSVTADFAHGTSVSGSLLVAADGAWSTIRQQYLPTFKPVDIEGRFFFGKTPITPEFRQAFNPAAMQHMAIVADRSGEVPISLLVEPMLFDHASVTSGDVQLPQDYMYWSCGSRVDRFDTSSLGKQPSPEDYASFVQRIAQNWHPSFQPLFQHQDVSQMTSIRLASMSPGIPLWQSTRVTLIGDAAHCMAPTAGVGATLALRDAGLLGSLLAEKGVSVESVTEYEKGMREGLEPALQMSVMVGKMMFGMRDFAELKPVA